MQAILTRRSVHEPRQALAESAEDVDRHLSLAGEGEADLERLPAAAGRTRPTELPRTVPSSEVFLAARPAQVPGLLEATANQNWEVAELPT